MAFNRPELLDERSGRKYLLWSILLLAALVLYFKWENHSIRYKYDYLRSEGISHFATIQNLRGRTKCIYEIGDETYDLIKTTPFKHLQNGEIYELIYAPDDPNKAIVLFDKPIIRDSSKYQITSIISNKTKWSSSRKIYFEYQVGSYIYERAQLVESENIQPEKVIYLKSNPRIAYLYFENNS